MTENASTTAPNSPVIAYPIEDVPAATGIKRDKVFDAIREGRLTAHKSGRNTIVEADELRRYVKSLPAKGRAPERARPNRAPPQPRNHPAAAIPDQQAVKGSESVNKRFRSSPAPRPKKEARRETGPKGKLVVYVRDTPSPRSPQRA